MEALIEFLNSIYPLSPALQEYLSVTLKRKQFDKKDFLLKKGHIAENVFFIEKGLVRCFYEKDSKEISSWFMKEADVIISVESFFKQMPGYENVQALEETEVLYINYNELMYAYKEFQEFNFVGRILTEKYYMLCEQRLYSLRMQHASERYKNLLKKSPEIIQRVPSQYIASYLGIAIETLSRVKGNK